jgi:DNA topoisomerase-1
MSKNLLIVESPAKAKTIEKYLGGDFTVLSSIGHIRSIAKKTKDGSPPIDVINGFKTTYEIDSEKKKVIAELKKAVKAASDVWLATDEDREGEAIAWHLCEVLKLDPEKTKRIVFHEITKNAIQEAIKYPKTVDMKLVEAQQARQILDRIVGFELSPVVWQKVPGGKSAGRVQSPAVRLLVEREREIRTFESTFQFKVTALFSLNDEEIRAELPQRFDTEKEAADFLESLRGATFTVDNISKSPSTRSPAAPFTTSTLQQDANAKLSFGARATMASAQKLYQAGKITYMRTDSVHLSGQAIAAAKDFISQKFGNKYSQVRQYKTRNTNAQEAHEAIRPTDMSLEIASSNEYDQKLYDLIRRRTLASQMASAELEKTTIDITVSSSHYRFEAKGEIVMFEGFLKVYGKNKEEILPQFTRGQRLILASAQAKQLFSKPPARYTEGSLVKKLEELGIGRPSTYATIIGTIQARGYAERGEGEGTPRDIIIFHFSDESIKREIITEKTGADRGKLIPTPAGELIIDFLSDHFNQIVDYSFTANVEEHFDDIAAAKLERNEMLRDFYTPFHALIEKSSDIDRSKVGGSREVGYHPKNNKPIIARFGRFGPMLQLGSTEDKSDKPIFAPMPRGASIDTVTLEQAIHAFTLPRLVGHTKDGEVINANIGRFGPYIQVGKLFVSIKPLDPHDITIEQALELYNEKLKKEAEKNIADFGDGIKILNGRWGAYITDGKKNAKIPKDTDPTKIKHEEAKKILTNAPDRKGRTRRFTKKK